MKDKLISSVSNERLEKNSVESKIKKAEEYFDNIDEYSHNKGKRISDTFSLRENDLAVIRYVMDKGLDRRIVWNKSQIIRAALFCLKKIDDEELCRIMERV